MYILSLSHPSSISCPVPGAYPLWGMCSEELIPVSQPISQSQSVELLQDWARLVHQPAVDKRGRSMFIGELGNGRIAQQ
jgi:hypothetical protein